ncbi:MAG: efflux RND transporter periplasmic adaptor subunit [Polyangiaceae bacterium]
MARRARERIERRAGGDRPHREGPARGPRRRSSGHLSGQAGRRRHRARRTAPEAPRWREGGREEGDLLAEIGVDEQRAALREAYARAKAAAVDVDFAGTELERTAALRASNALPQASLDRATREKNSAAAHREVAGAAAHRLETVIAKATVKAPIDGVVLVKHAEAGELVTAGAPLVTIADTSALRVEAEVDEFDGSRVAVGQAVSLWAEGYEGRFRGEVEEIPDEVVSRRIRPQAPGRPSDTRVLLVKVRLLDKTPLRLGQRVELEIAPPASSR